jgi:transposase
VLVKPQRPAPPPKRGCSDATTSLSFAVDGLAALMQDQLRRDPFLGQAFVFRGRRGRLIKVLSWDGRGLYLFAKRLEKGRFIWPATSAGAAAALTPCCSQAMMRSARVVLK